MVTEVDIKPGDIVAAGRPVFALVMSGKRWVEANFKETQLTHMHVGQKAEVDSGHLLQATPGRAPWRASRPGTGSVFSVLPAQNATGNWVKVVQRIPVRIALDQLPARTGPARRHERQRQHRYPLQPAVRRGRAPIRAPTAVAMNFSKPAGGERTPR